MGTGSESSVKEEIERKAVEYLEKTNIFDKTGSLDVEAYLTNKNFSYEVAIQEYAEENFFPDDQEKFLKEVEKLRIDYMEKEDILDKTGSLDTKKYQESLTKTYNKILDEINDIEEKIYADKIPKPS